MLSVPSPEPLRAIHRRHYVGIFLLAFATLLLELASTRVLSVTLWYHFGFLVISTALLGFGVSGVVLALWSWLREKAELDRALSVIALLFGVLTIGCFWLAQRIPFDPFSLLTDKRQWWSTPLYSVVVSLPFFCSGLALSLLFTRGTAHVNRLYAFDLFGAGLGCGAIALVMPQFGGSGSVVVAAGVGLLSAVVFGLRQARGWAVAGLILAVATGPLAVVADRLLPITITSNKRQPAVAPVATEWNTFSRIDTYGNLPPNPRRPLAHRAFFFDAGTAVTAIPDLRPDWRTAAKAFEGRYRYDSQLAYLGKQQPRLLIIGSGAGAEVFAGMVHGAASITAVEINPIINRAIVENRDGYWGGLFDEPAVTLVTEEGRSFVRRSKERFDAIISAHTISNAAIASGTLSLAENYVLTREAFDDYLDHLVDDGVLYFTRPEYQMPRLFATGREALEARGVRGVQAHFYALKGSATIGEGRSVFYAIFLMKRSPFTPADVEAMNRFIGVSENSAPGLFEQMHVLYSPFDPIPGSIYETLLTTPDLKAAYAAHTAEIAPATDNRPFFNHHTRWSAIRWDTLRDLLSQDSAGRLALEDRPVTEITLLFLLAQTVLVAGVLILLPLARLARSRTPVPQRWRFLAYFAALGLGFILIEIVFLQHFTLYLGQPVYTFAVVLAGLLIFTGIGSHLAGGLRGAPRQRLRWIVPVLLGLLVCTAMAAPGVFAATLGWPLGVRIAIALLVIFPLSVVLGMPFPTGLRIVGAEAPPLVPWAWGVNGFFTVIGTVVALIGAMTFGFYAVLGVAGLCYLIALVVMYRTAADAPATPAGEPEKLVSTPSSRP